MNITIRQSGRVGIALCLGLLPAFTWSQDKVPPAPEIVVPREPDIHPKSLGLPETVSPMIGFYQGIDPKEKKIKLAFVEAVAEVVAKTVRKNGVDEIVEEVSYKPVAIAGSVPFGDIQFWNTQGKRLTVESVIARLKPGDTLVISGDEKAIGPAYLKVIHPDAIIAIFPLDPFIEPYVNPTK
jgi:hypothetical protein